MYHVDCTIAVIVKGDGREDITHIGRLYEKLILEEIGG